MELRDFCRDFCFVACCLSLFLGSLAGAMGMGEEEKKNPMVPLVEEAVRAEEAPGADDGEPEAVKFKKARSGALLRRLRQGVGVRINDGFEQMDQDHSPVKQSRLQRAARYLKKEKTREPETYMDGVVKHIKTKRSREKVKHIFGM